MEKKVRILQGLKNMSIISLNSKQYVLNPGDQVAVLKLDKNPGEVFVVKDMITGKDLNLRVVEDKKGDKIKVLKFIKKKGYKRVTGSREHLTIIELAGEQVKKPAAKAAKKTTK